VSEEVNRKCRPGNTTVQLSTPYTDRERYTMHRHRQKDRQTDDSIVPIADHVRIGTIG